MNNPTYNITKDKLEFLRPKSYLYTQNSLSGYEMSSYIPIPLDVC
jgi:hypothetical protein